MYIYQVWRHFKFIQQIYHYKFKYFVVCFEFLCKKMPISPTPHPPTHPQYINPPPYLIWSFFMKFYGILEISHKFPIKKIKHDHMRRGLINGRGFSTWYTSTRFRMICLKFQWISSTISSHCETKSKCVCNFRTHPYNIYISTVAPVSDLPFLYVPICNLYAITEGFR